MFGLIDQLAQGAVEVIGLNGLGEVGVHARLEGALHILVKGVGGQGDARMAAAASSPSISGMRMSMRTAS